MVARTPLYKIRIVRRGVKVNESLTRSRTTPASRKNRAQRQGRKQILNWFEEHSDAHMFFNQGSYALTIHYAGKSDVNPKVGLCKFRLFGDSKDGKRASADDMTITENSTPHMHTIFVHAGNDRSKV